jgi:hypothetical protein
MADSILATLLLLGGLGWSFVVFAAAANDPHGGSGAIYPFLMGVAAAVAGLAYWGWIIAGWVF